MSTQEHTSVQNDEQTLEQGRRDFLSRSTAFSGLLATAQLGIAATADAEPAHISAQDVLYALIEAILDGKKASELFAEDGVLELPYLYSIGLEQRYVGCEAIAKFYDFVKDLYVDFKFTRSQTKVLIDTPGQLYADYANTVTTRGTGRKVH